MANKNPSTKHLARTQWKPGQSGNPVGKPKGTRHISTWIQLMVNDPQFKATLTNQNGQRISYKGAPIMAIINTAIIKALEGDKAWADWLAKYGYANESSSEHEVTYYKEVLAKRRQYGL